MWWIAINQLFKFLIAARLAKGDHSNYYLEKETNGKNNLLNQMSKRIPNQATGKRGTAHEEIKEENSEATSPPVTQEALEIFFSRVQEAQANMLREAQEAMLAQILQMQMEERQKIEDIASRQEILERSQANNTEGTTNLRRQDITSPTTSSIHELDINLPETNIRRVNRRDSAYNRLTTFKSNAKEGVLSVESDKHLNIIWSVRTVDGFLKFLEDIDKFVLTYNQQIPYLFTHISEDLQEVLAELLYVHKPQKYTSKNDVFKVTTQDLFDIVQIYFAPKDLGHFNILLLGACKKYEVFQKGEYFAPTRLKLYGLRQKFRERFEFLSEGAARLNRRDAIPAINYKFGGLLNIWTDLTPEGTRDSFRQMLINGKYESIDDFLEKYFAKVDETNLLSENIKVYKYRIGSDKKAQDRDGEYTSRQRKVGHLNALEGEDEEDDLDEEAVFALEGPRPTDYSQEPCSRLLMNDRCWSRECKFSHKPKIIEGKKKELLEKWSQLNGKTTAEKQLIHSSSQIQKGRTNNSFNQRHLPRARSGSQLHQSRSWNLRNKDDQRRRKMM